MYSHAFEVSRGAARQKASVFSYARSGKRTFDIVVTLLLLLAFLPLILLLAIAVAFDGGRPFFGHARVGRGGRMFSCWKLRSMVPDAEDRLRQLLLTDPQAAAEWARDSKLRHDPRISPVGNILRRTSLDELPQLWNVLRGDMSLVGPRPVPHYEMERYGAAAPVYLSVRPGLTGLWQVSGRNSISYDNRVKLDQQYVHGLSFWNDLKILAMTVPAVLSRSGC